LKRTARKKKPFGISSSVQAVNIKMDMKEMRYEVVGWIQMAHARVHLQDYVNTVINFQIL
jgi:hypothetical protein